MSKLILTAALAFFSLAGVTAADAAPCKDAKDKFVKCPPAKPVPCKDARGKFVTCSAPGATPIR